MVDVFELSVQTVWTCDGAVVHICAVNHSLRLQALQVVALESGVDGLDILMVAAEKSDALLQDGLLAVACLEVSLAQRHRQRRVRSCRKFGLGALDL